MPQHLWLFLLGSVVVTLVPGADMALVARQVVTRGRATAQVTIAGNVSGLVVHTVALAAGLSALLVASATAYTAVKLAGATYLVYLGLQSLRQARRSRAGTGARPVRTPENSLWVWPTALPIFSRASSRAAPMSESSITL